MKQEIKFVIKAYRNSEISRLNRYTLVVTETGAEFLVVILKLTDHQGNPAPSGTYFVGVFEDGEWIKKFWYDELIEATDMYKFQITDLL